MSDLAKLDVKGAIATLTLNRPESRNALSRDLLDALHTRVDELGTHPDVKVLVITGEGKAFCAGMDLKLVMGDPQAAEALLVSLARLCLKVRSLPQVVIGKINGAAIGGGCGLACVCDFALTHKDAKLGFPEVDLGVCPAVVAPWLVRRIGPGRARKVLLAGGLMTGEEAMQLGMISKLCNWREELDRAVDEFAQHIATGGSAALRATKGLLNELDGSYDEELALRTARLSAQVLMTPEAQQMLRAKMGS